MLQKLVSPVDFSEHSERAVAFAVALAGQLSASLDLLHVYQAPYYTHPRQREEVARKIKQDYRDMGREAMDEYMTRLGPRPAGVELVSHVISGEPHEEICRHAVAQGADLIIMGTHGRTGLTRLLMGSVAERVIRTSRVPVLTVPLPS